MADLQEYKCPCCGGAIEFNSNLQKMKCPYCDTEFEMEVLSQYDDEIQNDKTTDMSWHMESEQFSGEDAEGLGVYVCQSCGGEIVADENTAASVCPFCDNPVVIKGQIKGGLKPQYIIPFKLDKKAAKEKFAEHLKGKKLLPKVFQSQNHIDEIKGIYVPYWLFDTKANAHMRYKGTRTRFWSDSKYNYTETSHFAIIREGDISFAHVPVDGSSKMEDELMESLEPYNFTEAVPFQSGFFAGYYADKYDLDDQAVAQRANERVKRTTEDSFRNTVTGFDSVVHDGGSITLSGGKASYAMYPVWILNTTWNGETYRFAMNGQTGKFVGDLPVDKSAMKKYFIKTLAIVTAIVYALLSVIWLLG